MSQDWAVHTRPGSTKIISTHEIILLMQWILALVMVGISASRPDRITFDLQGIQPMDLSEDSIPSSLDS